MLHTRANTASASYHLFDATEIQVGLSPLCDCMRNYTTYFCTAFYLFLSFSFSILLTSLFLLCHPRLFSLDCLLRLRSLIHFLNLFISYFHLYSFFSCSFLTFSPSPPLPCSHQREYLSEISSWKYPAQTDRSTSPPLRLSSPSPLQQPDRTTKGPECTRLASEMATEWRWQRSTFPFPLWFPRGRSSSRRVKIDRKRLAGCYRKRVSFSRGRIAGLS